MSTLRQELDEHRKALDGFRALRTITKDEQDHLDALEAKTIPISIRVHATH